MEALRQGDCIEDMQSMPGESIDMIFADPPFNPGKKYGGKSARSDQRDDSEWCEKRITEGFCPPKTTGAFEEGL